MSRPRGRLPADFPIEVDERERTVTVAAGVSQRILLDFLDEYRCDYVRMLLRLSSPHARLCFVDRPLWSQSFQPYTAAPQNSSDAAALFQRRKKVSSGGQTRRCSPTLQAQLLTVTAFVSTVD